MSVVIETTLGDLTVDLFLSERPTACMNFLKLCKLKYYNYNLFHTISRGFIAQTGDPTGSRTGGQSIFGVLKGSERRYFQGENKPRLKHTKMGLISFVGNDNFMVGSQFFITLGEDLTYLDEKHCVFGELVEGFDVLEIINEVICDGDDRPYQDVRITHTVILDDPIPDPEGLNVPSRSPSPSIERLKGGRIAPDEEIDDLEGKSIVEVMELQAEQEAKARATILEMVGDIPDAEMAPPENVLFVCKLNPVTTDEDLEIIFNRFGKIKSCEVIRDRKTGDSLQYAFIEFDDQKSCEDAYFKMDNILIDDRRIHVDFSQSVSKVKWHGKGRGVTHFNDKGQKVDIDGKQNSISLKISNKEEKHNKKEKKQDKYFHSYKVNIKTEQYDARESRSDKKRSSAHSRRHNKDGGEQYESSFKKRDHKSNVYDKQTYISKGRSRRESFSSEEYVKRSSSKYISNKEQKRYSSERKSRATTSRGKEQIKAKEIRNSSTHKRRRVEDSNTDSTDSSTDSTDSSIDKKSKRGRKYSNSSSDDSHYKKKQVTKKKSKKKKDYIRNVRLKSSTVISDNSFKRRNKK